MWRRIRVYNPWSYTEYMFLLMLLAVIVSITTSVVEVYMQWYISGWYTISYTVVTLHYHMYVCICKSLAFESIQTPQKAHVVKCFLPLILWAYFRVFCGKLYPERFILRAVLKRLWSKIRLACSFLKITQGSLSRGSVCVRAQADFRIGEVRCSKTHLYTALRGLALCSGRANNRNWVYIMYCRLCF